MIMQLQLDIRESWGKGQQKEQEEYEALTMFPLVQSRYH